MTDRIENFGGLAARFLFLSDCRECLIGNVTDDTVEGE